MVPSAPARRDFLGSIYPESRGACLVAFELDTLTDNCYEGTTYLINKFDIRDNKQLVIEIAIAYTKPPNWSANLSAVILILRSTKLFTNIFFEDILRLGWHCLDS